MSRRSGAMRSIEPGISIGKLIIEIPDQFALRTVRNDDLE